MCVKADSEDTDISAIKRVMRKQFGSLIWCREKDADWNAFANTFLPGALLFPAARPVKAQTIDQFIDRMKRLRADGKHESNVTRDVSATVLVRENGIWRIAAQAWDIEAGACKMHAACRTPYRHFYGAA